MALCQGECIAFPPTSIPYTRVQVLEDISSFRFAGRRMHHNAPSRSSRRLADKIATVEKEGTTPAAKIELLRRLNDDEYEQVGDGRELRPAMRCADIPSGEVTRLLENGYVMFPPPGWTWGDDDDDDESVEIKSEPDPIDFPHGDRGLDGDPGVGERQDRLVAGHAVLDGQQGVASQSGAEGSGARLEIASGTAAGGDHMAGNTADGESATRARPTSPLPGWETLPGASESRPPSTRPGDRAECVMS